MYFLKNSAFPVLAPSRMRCNESVLAWLCDWSITQDSAIVASMRFVSDLCRFSDSLAGASLRSRG